MKKIRKFIKLSIIVYIVLCIFVFFPLVVFPGSDIVGGTFTYFGLVILAGVLLYIFDKE